MEKEMIEMIIGIIILFLFYLSLLILMSIDLLKIYRLDLRKKTKAKWILLN